MPKTSLSAIHTELQRVQGDLANAREIVNSERGDYTVEGAQKAYLNRIQHYNTAKQLDTARNQVEQVRAGALKNEVSRVLFLGICLDFHYFLGRVGFPK
ncbi:hypothetical protein, partial [Corynebacterium sp. MSK195]|uniref:hypothetical protein n=1 Tax=Corynebacterium sp. MSK195 TaxID=3050216 RepID=UPI00254A7F01